MVRPSAKRLWGQLIRETPRVRTWAGGSHANYTVTRPSRRRASSTFPMVPFLQGPLVIASKRFPMSADSVVRARHFVRQVLGQCSAVTVDTAELLTSELATNAVVHGHTSFDVSISHGEGLLRIAVSDGNDHHPAVRAPDYADLHGRGMQLVEHLADSWGSTGHYPGKTVWFDIVDRSIDRDGGRAQPSPSRSAAARSARRDPPGAGPPSTWPQGHQIVPGSEGIGRAAHRLHR
jgi:anti-sigma regulatory factor (Ser/Thr protein kinase)